MVWDPKKCLAGALTVSVTACCVSSSFGAAVLWGMAQNIAGPGSTTVATSADANAGTIAGSYGNTTGSGTNDVSQLGTSVLALNFTGAHNAQYGNDVTIGGTTFITFSGNSTVSNFVPTAYTQGGVTFHNGSADGVYSRYAGVYPGNPLGSSISQSYGTYHIGGSNFGDLGFTISTLVSGVYGNSPNAANSFTGLTLGHMYQVQLWVNDERPGFNSRNEVVSDGVGDDVTLNFQTATGSGQFVTGVFTADSSTQNFSLAGNYAGTQLNLIQLRDITVVPEPVSLSSLSLFGLGVLSHRRRAKSCVWPRRILCSADLNLSHSVSH